MDNSTTKDTSIIKYLKKFRTTKNFTENFRKIIKGTVNDNLVKATLIELVCLTFPDGAANYLYSRDVVLTSWGLLKEYSLLQGVQDRRAQYVLDTGYIGRNKYDESLVSLSPDDERYEDFISKGKGNLVKHENDLYEDIDNYYKSHYLSESELLRFMEVADRKWIPKETGEVMLPSRSNYTVAPPDTTKPSESDDETSAPPDPQPDPQPEPQRKSHTTSKATRKPTRRRFVVLLAVGTLVAVTVATIFLLAHKESKEEDENHLTAEEFEQAIADIAANKVPNLDTFKFVSAEDEEDYEISNQWGNSGDSRRMYATDEINKGVLGDTVTFNSITDSTVGNEGKFVGAKIADSSDNTWINDYVDVRHGETYTICLYVHNDNPGGLDAVSDDTSISFSLPETVDTSLTVCGYISSSNATPDYYGDTVTFKSDEAFSLEYVEGSARFTNEKMKAISLSDGQVFNGHPIGYDRFDGKIPGGDKYIGVAMIDVVIKSSRSYELAVSARLEGTKARNYRTMDANVGDVIEYVIEYQNLRNTPVQNITITDELSINAEYIKGSTVVYDYYHQDGVPDKTDNLFTQNGLNIGNYDTGGNALIIFKARIVDNTLGEGKNLVSNFVKLCNEEYADPSAIHADDEVTVYVIK